MITSTSALSPVKTDRRQAQIAVALCALIGAHTAACSDGDEREGEGTVVARAYGEPFIEEGIPADEMVDGWSVTFARFMVHFSDVVVGGTPISVQPSMELAANSDGEGHMIGSGAVAAGDHTDASFVLGRVEVEGTATDGTVTKNFRWDFDVPTAYTACETVTEVRGGESTVFEITVHADHLFYDSLVADDPDLRFQALADADIDGDGAIDPSELAATDIGDYDPGSAGGVDDLWTWLEAQVRTLGHVDGEGHCDSAPATP